MKAVKLTQKLSYTIWLIRLKYCLIGQGVMTSNRHHKNTPDRNSWRHFYDDGFSPIEAVLIDINES